MPEQQFYRLVFEGKTAQGFSTEDVKENFSRLFKVDGERLDRLFSGKAYTLKQDLDFLTMTRYGRVLDQAGALYRIDPPLAAVAAAPQRKVIECEPQIEALKYGPKPCPRVTGGPAGIDLNRHDIKTVAFNQIRLVSIFAEKVGKAENISLFIFIQGSGRPYSIEANRIAFSDFFCSGDMPSVKRSLKNFILFLLEKNPTIMIDRTTDSFLETERPDTSGRSAAGHATALGMYLERDDGRAKPPRPPLPQRVDGRQRAAVHGKSGTGAVAPDSQGPRPSRPQMASQATPAPPVPASAVRQGAGPVVAADAPGRGALADKPPGEPQMKVNAFGWSELLIANVVANVLLLLVIGIVRSPNIIYGFLVEQIEINGSQLRFDDPFIWIRSSLYALLIIPFVLNVFLVEEYSKTFGIFFPLTIALLVIGFCAGAVVFTNSFLLNTTYKNGISPFEPLYRKRGIKPLLSYIRKNFSEFLAIVFSGVCFMSVLLIPIGVAKISTVVIDRIRVDGYRYRVEIPWGRTLLWCLLGYLSLFLGHFRYIAILYEQVFPNGRWVRENGLQR